MMDPALATFDLPADLDLIFMLEPYPGITEEQWTALDDWIEAGGTLVLAGSGQGAFLAARHFDFTLDFIGGSVATAVPQSPLFTSPPLTQPVPIHTRTFWQTGRTDFVTHLVAGAKPVVVSVPQGNGRVILSATAYPFSNAGLKEAGNAELVLNTLTVEPGSTIWFDEWHHGIQATQASVTGPTNWLRHTPAGHSLIYVALVIFVASVLNGRRFGRAITPPQNKLRRAPIEHITAMANLSRRAGHRRDTLQKYHGWLKRDLGRRYRLNPTLPDEEYARQLAAYNPHINQAALSRLLAELRQPDPGESRLVELAAEVARWTQGKT
ncbi:MAG: DUF4350 domain-containing protein [Anaerolineae bacterium]